VERLVAEGRIERDEHGDHAALRASPLVIPIGADLGWEAAVFDHFRAVASAIAAKVRRGRTRSAEDDVVGGTTLSYRVHPGHPHWARVRELLSRVRTEAISLWDEVEAHNVAQPFPEDESTRVWFYVGQYLEPDHPEER
jgi:hypothetical protein